MNVDSIDRELGGPMVVREQGRVLVLPAATELSWRVVAATILDPHYFVAYIWPQDAPLTAWKLDLAHESWCRHNALGGPEETRQLIHYIDKYYRALEYDLRKHLQVDLGATWRARRWRELLSYIQQLPSNTRLNALLANDEEHLEAALRAADRNKESDNTPSGPSMADWNHLNDQMAMLIDAVNRNTEVTRAAAGGKQGNVKPAPRPTTAAERVRNRLQRERHEEMAAILLRDRPERAGMMQGSTPSSAE